MLGTPGRGVGEDAHSPAQAAAQLHALQDLQLPAQSAWCAPALARAPLCLEQECPHRHIKLQCRRFKYYQRGLTKGCIVITRALIKGNTLN